MKLKIFRKLRHSEIGIGNKFIFAIMALFSILLISSTLIVLTSILSLNLLSSFIKTTINNNTDFYIANANIKYELFKNKFIIKNLEIYNPSKYNNETFVKVEEIKLDLNPLKIIFSEFEIISMNINIDKINCERLNSYNYNISEFLLKLKKLSSIKDNKLKEFSIYIEEGSFSDTSTSEKVEWTNDIKFSYKTENISDLDKLVDDIITGMNNSDASYISDGLKVLKK